MTIPITQLTDEHRDRLNALEHTVQHQMRELSLLKWNVYQNSVAIARLRTTPALKPEKNTAKKTLALDGLKFAGGILLILYGFWKLEPDFLDAIAPLVKSFTS